MIFSSITSPIEQRSYHYNLFRFDYKGGECDFPGFFYIFSFIFFFSLFFADSRLVFSWVCFIMDEVFDESRVLFPSLQVFV